ncbi:MAG TPA: hypothetical protein VIK74_00650, partial [Parasegetibacter sp.]
FERYDASRNLMTQFWPYGDNGLMIQNPFWVTQRDLFQNNKERYMTTVSLRYQLADWINLSGRVKMDKTNEKHEKKFAASTNTLFASETGYYSLNTHDTRLIYAEAMAAINKQLGERVGLNLNLGTSVDDVTYNQYLFGGKLAGVPNLFTYANVNRNDAEMSQSGYKRQKQSVFATSHLNYDEKVYLELTGRNDWASTLAATQKGYSFFYPSVGLSGILSEIFNVRTNFLSYLKVRGSYSEVGNEPPVHLTISTYELAGGMPVSFSYLPFTELQPERTKSFELGLNAAFFRGALKLDATVYKSRTFNQIFDVTVSQSSSYDRVFINAGRIDNEGIEASLAYTGKFGKFNWTSALSYSLNRNKIVEMVPNWTDPTTGGNITLDELDMSGTGSYKMVLRKGGSMGDIFVNTLRVDEHGAIYVDPGSQGVVGEPNKFVYAGNNNPLYNAGWNNTFSWNGISLNVLFTARVGGIVVSNTQAIMDAFGASQSTADARDAGGALVNGRPVPSKEYYSVVGAGASGGIASMYVYSATNVRLGELSLGYDLPVRNWLRFVKSANVSLVGRNLLFLYNAAPFDPELTANTQTYYQGIDYFMAPSLRSLGFSVKLNF